MQAHAIITIGSRGSDLALWQANYVQNELKRHGFESKIEIIVTKGDRIQDLSFDKIEGKGFFTKEIEDALLEKRIDLAVHSLKDLPTTSPAGLQIAALSYREDPRDLLIIRKDACDPATGLGVKKGGRIGTSSARRKVQIALLQADLEITDLRGNVPTRIQKCRSGAYDAIIIAAAGVTRLQLDMSDFITVALEPDRFVPAPAQGVLGLQIRTEDLFMEGALSAIHNTAVAEVVAVERQTLNLFEGGCHMPVGVYCTKANGIFTVMASKSENDHQLPIRIELKSETSVGLPERLLALCNKPRQGKIFISRNESTWPMLGKQLRDHGYETLFEALIETKTIQSNALQATDWLFFVSRNTVVHFLKQHKPLSGTKIAAVGEGTAQALHAAGLQVDFTGLHTDITAVAADFALQFAGSSVLFPVGNRSRNTVQNALQNHCLLTEIQVYETVLLHKCIENDCLALVFSSPSSAEAFLMHNRIHSEQLVVAMGEATAEFLSKQGLHNVVIPSGYRQDQIATAIFSHL
jgi:hydroxymethylbilane synthase